MLCDGGVTARNRYQTNAVEVHDFMKLCGHRPMNTTVGQSLGGVVLTDTVQHTSHVYDHCVNET
jgi:alpha-beta hydrolase superfamily lysophospholipase